MSGTDVAARVARLESWVEAVMLAVGSIDVEGLLTELDHARGEYGDEADESSAVGRVSPQVARQ
jgi:hypothetical protein